MSPDLIRGWNPVRRPGMRQTKKLARLRAGLFDNLIGKRRTRSVVLARMTAYPAR
jgi:hypothetical protein